MEKLPINLIFFTSTKGHFGHKDIYQHTLNSLKKQIAPERIGYKVAHIKVSPDEHHIAYEMMDFLEQWGFDKILTTEANWSHDGNHGEEYTKDIQKTLEYLSVNPNTEEFTLWMEDDYIFNINKETKCPQNLDFYFDRAINVLKSNFRLQTVRFNLDKPDKDKILQYDDLVYLQKKNYTPYQNTVTFQPTIYRTKDLWWSYCVFLKNNWEKLKHTHIELRSGYSLFPLTDSPMPFAEFNYDIVRSIHIGTKNYKEILKQHD